MNEKTRKVFEKCCYNFSTDDKINFEFEVDKLKELKEMDLIDINEIYDGAQEIFKDELYKMFKQNGLIS